MISIGLTISFPFPFSEPACPCSCRNSEQRRCPPTRWGWCCSNRWLVHSRGHIRRAPFPHAYHELPGQRRCFCLIIVWRNCTQNFIQFRLLESTINKCFKCFYGWIFVRAIGNNFELGLSQDSKRKNSQHRFRIYATVTIFTHFQPDCTSKVISCFNKVF